MTKPLIVLTLLAALAGCATRDNLDRRYISDRPEYGDNALPNPGPDVPAPHVDIINPDPSRPELPIITTAITGTWTFTTPAAVTRVERKNDTLTQFSLYKGRPAATATPIVVITVSPDARSQAQSDPDAYKVQNTRSYVLNGNLAKEWTGTTSDGSGFSEIILTHPGLAGGDVCHAVAIAGSAEDRKLALEILGSLTWKPNDQ